MTREVINWGGDWWLVENRGTATEPHYMPISQHRTKAEAKKAEAKKRLDECQHINGLSRWEEPDGSVSPGGSESDLTEWVRRCQGCDVRLDEVGGLHEYREPEREDAATGYRYKA